MTRLLALLGGNFNFGFPTGAVVLITAGGGKACVGRMAIGLTRCPSGVKLQNYSISSLSSSYRSNRTLTFFCL